MAYCRAFIHFITTSAFAQYKQVHVQSVFLYAASHYSDQQNLQTSKIDHHTIIAEKSY